jgi:hypothetical protein
MALLAESFRSAFVGKNFMITDFFIVYIPIKQVSNLASILGCDSDRYCWPHLKELIPHPKSDEKLTFLYQFGIDEESCLFADAENVFPSAFRHTNATIANTSANCCELRNYRERLPCSCRRMAKRDHHAIGPFAVAFINKKTKTGMQFGNLVIEFIDLWSGKTFTHVLQTTSNSNFH